MPQLAPARPSITFHACDRHILTGLCALVMTVIWTNFAKHLLPNSRQHQCSIYVMCTATPAFQAVWRCIIQLRRDMPWYWLKGWETYPLNWREFPMDAQETIWWKVRSIWLRRKAGPPWDTWERHLSRGLWNSDRVHYYISVTQWIRQEQSRECIATDAFHDERGRMGGKRRCTTVISRGQGPKPTLPHSANIGLAVGPQSWSWVF